jgi:hypothetical protein
MLRKSPRISSGRVVKITKTLEVTGSTDEYLSCVHVEGLQTVKKLASKICSCLTRKLNSHICNCLKKMNPICSPHS